MDDSNIVDIYFGRRFGHKNKESKEEFFKGEFFVEHIIKDKERIEQFLNKDTEGSPGPCRFCKDKNTFLIEKQKRSADEMKDMSIHCGACGRSWQAL